MVKEAQVRTEAAAQKFIDLYELLHLSPETDSDTLRKHINQTYLEAQQNLDHRNAHKRLQFQQLFEIYLPQARHLLLDPVRRAEYDRYLRAYRSGSSVEPAPADAPQPRVPRTASETSSQSPADHTSLTAIEQQVDAEKLAAEREELWAKWKNGLEHSQETEKQQEERLKAQQDAEEAARASLKAATVEMSAVVASNGSAKSTLSGSLSNRASTAAPGEERRQGQERRTAPRDTSERRVAGRSWTVNTPAATEKHQQELEAERQREARRLAAISEKSRAAAMTWGFGSAIAFFVVSFGILSLLFGALSSGSSNMVTNGEFSRQFIGWGKPDTATVVAANAGPFKTAARTTVLPRFGSNPWDITLRQDIASPMSQGSPLTLRFWARSPESLPFSASVTENTPEHDKSLTKDFALTPDWREYVISGKALENYGPRANYVEFFMSYRPGTYEIAGVRLTSASSPIPNSLFGVPINIVVAAILALIALAIGRQMAEIGRNRTSEALHAQQK
jgi:curved DNA-binding protein CbpA